MSLKDDVNYVKGELSGDEKLLESAFRLERLYKKHKIKIWAVVILLLIGFGGKAGYGAYQEYRISKANRALLALEKNPADKTALEALKVDNPKLFALYSYATAVKKGEAERLKGLEGIKDPVLSDLARYHEAVLQNRAGDSGYYHDLSLVEKAYLALKAGKKEEARRHLALVSEASPVAGIARLLRHYTIK